MLGGPHFSGHPILAGLCHCAELGEGFGAAGFGFEETLGDPRGNLGIQNSLRWLSYLGDSLSLKNGGPSIAGQPNLIGCPREPRCQKMEGLGAVGGIWGFKEHLGVREDSHNSLWEAHYIGDLLCAENRGYLGPRAP